MRQQDLVWVRLPYSNLEETKVRPAVVMSHDAYNEAHDDVVVCAVTSNLEPAPHKVPVSSEDLSEGELPLNSMARADKVLPVEKSLVERSFAHLGDAAYDRIVDALNGLVRRPSA